MEKAKAKKKRVLKNPIKKWTLSETRLIVKYLKENQRVEKPSAQIYYKRLLAEHPEITASWDLIRYKVKNIRVAYMKARDWVNGEGTNLRELDGYYFNERLNQICPFFNDLQQIFGDRVNCCKIRNKIENNLEENMNSAATVAQQNDTFLTMSMPPTTSSSSSASYHGGLSLSTSPTDLAKKVRKLYKTSIHELSELQKERKEGSKEKLAFKEKWKMAELEFQQQKLEFEKEKFWEEMNLKKLEIDSRERIRKMEIEKETYALELKYKCLSSNEQ